MTEAQATEIIELLKLLAVYSLAGCLLLGLAAGGIFLQILLAAMRAKHLLR